MRDEWFQDFFRGVAIEFWRRAVSPEQTQAEVDFLESVLGRTPDWRWLDMPCGHGRHALELARRGHRVTGVDLSSEEIEEAQRRTPPDLDRVKWVCQDMRQFHREGEFDAAYCFGNSFGYFPHQDLTVFLRTVAKALKPGARFALQSGVAAEACLPNLKFREWYQVDDLLLLLDRRYHAGQSAIETEATFIHQGQTEKRTWWHWVFTVAEIKRLLHEAGLETEALYGSLDQKPFEFGNPMLLLVARKSTLL